MERKIGEIFEYNGEWLQCVEQPKKYDKTVCAICAFQGNGNCELDRCSGTYRSDKKFVIFKKLEKVGEPYEFDGHLFQSYRTFEVPIFTENYATVRELGNNSKISIEIKQNKEDMGDLDKIKVRDYTKVEELNVMEENKLNLKPFDIQKAREGKPVCTREGRKARIICFDAEGEHPIIALVSDGVRESPYNYTKEGYYHIEGVETMADLMMLPEKKEGWVNIYNRYSAELTSDGYFYFTKEEALSNIENDGTYVKTIKMSWEE
jgi:hypothetical protein